MIRKSHNLLGALAMVLWLGLTLAPVVLAEETWQEFEHSSLDALFASTQHPATSFQTASLDQVSVWFPKSNGHAARQAEELRQLTSDYFAAAMVERGMTLTASTDDDDSAVIVRVQLIDLRSLPGEGNVPDWANNFRFPVAPGRVTMIAELVDAASGQTILRMADLQNSTVVDMPDALDGMLRQWGDIVAQHAVVVPGRLQLVEVR